MADLPRRHAAVGLESMYEMRSPATLEIITGTGGSLGFASKPASRLRVEHGSWQGGSDASLRPPAFCAAARAAGGGLLRPSNPVGGAAAERFAFVADDPVATDPPAGILVVTGEAVRIPPLASPKPVGSYVDAPKWPPRALNSPGLTP